MKYQNAKKMSFFRRLPKPIRTVMLGLPLVMLIGGAYLLLLIYSPRLAFVPVPALAAAEERAAVLPDAQPAPAGDYLSIDKLNLQVPFFTGGEKTLEKGAWHRFPERGDPEKGGNFILSAHRFNLGLTPQRTKARSPFYNLHKLAPGDSITVQFRGKPYIYEVTRLYEVGPNETRIEESSSTAKLTLYTCAMAGSDAGRLVLEAEPAS